MKTYTMSNERIAKIKQAIDAIRLDANKGAILEFGVFEGYSLSQIIRHLRKSGLENPVYGFDSFSGIPIDEGVWHKGDFTSTLEKTERELTIALDDIPKEYHNYRLISGVFNESLTPQLKLDLKLDNAALIHIDSDTYDAAITVLDWCRTLIKDGTFVIFDEWSSEQRAWIEFVNKNKINAVDLGQIDDQRLFRVV